MQRILFGALAALTLFVVGNASLFMVDQREYAVVRQIGEIRRVIDQPGLYLKVPLIQSITYFDKRILTIDTADVDRFITSEKLNVQVDSFVKWRIADPKKFVVSVGGSELIGADRISRSVRDAMNNEIAKRTVSDMISGEREQMMASVRGKVAEDAKQIGADIIDVRMKRVDFAPEVSERVFDRMQAERKRVANERRATGSAESEKIRADADRQREVILAEAYRDAQATKGEGDGTASAIYAKSFGQDPQFAQFYRSLEAYRASFRNRSDVMVLDPSSDFFRYFRSSGGRSNAAEPASSGSAGRR